MSQPVEPRILVVDDDQSITELLSDLLEMEGYKVLVCNSSKDVLYLSRQFLPDVLLLDIMMPEIDGFDVCRYFRSDPQLQSTRIIVISAHDVTESRMEGYRAGADAFVSKPFNIDELRLIVANSVRSKKTTDAQILEAQTMSMQDPVARCYSWRYMEERIRDEFKRADRHTHPLSFVLVDLDRFELVNTKFGYEFGNEVLRKVVETIRKGIRESDIFGRYQQDAFIILLPQTTAEGARSAVARVEQLLDELSFGEKKRFSVDATVVHNTVQTGKPEVVLANLEERLRKAQQRKLGKR